MLQQKLFKVAMWSSGGVKHGHAFLAAAWNGIFLSCVSYTAGHGRREERWAKAILLDIPGRF